MSQLGPDPAHRTVDAGALREFGGAFMTRLDAELSMIECLGLAEWTTQPEIFEIPLIPDRAERWGWYGVGIPK